MKLSSHAEKFSGNTEDSCAYYINHPPRKQSVKFKIEKRIGESNIYIKRGWTFDKNKALPINIRYKKQPTII